MLRTSWCSELTQHITQASILDDPERDSFESMRSSLDDRIRLLDEKLAAVTASLDMHSQSIGSRRPEDDGDEDEEENGMNFALASSIKQSSHVRSGRTTRSTHHGIFDGPSAEDVNVEEEDEEDDRYYNNASAEESAESLMEANAIRGHANEQPATHSTASASLARMQSLVDELDIVRMELAKKRSEFDDMQNENEKLRSKLKRIDAEGINSSLPSQIEKHERDEDGVEESASRLRAQLKKTEAELKENTKKLDALQLRNNQLVDQLEHAGNLQKQESLVLDQELRSALKELEEERDRVTGMSEENKILHESLVREQEKVKETMLSHEENVAALEDKESRLKQLDARKFL